MNEQAIFLKLYVAEEAGIKAFVRLLVRNRRDFDDVFQTVVMRLWEKFDRYDSERPFGPWARGVAAKEVLAYRRDEGRCPTPFSPEVVTRLLDSMENSVEPPAGEREVALEKCLQALPRKSRDLLSLRYGQSLSMARIAEQVDHTTMAVQRTLSRIRAQLIECVESRLTAARVQPESKS